MTAGITLAARPSAITFVPEKTALIVIDMQRDFIEPGGFGAALGNDVTLLRRASRLVEDKLGDERVAFDLLRAGATLFPLDEPVAASARR